MRNFFKDISRVFDGFIINLILIGILLLVFAVLIAFVDFVLRLVIAVAFLAVACILFYGAYKLHTLKKHIKDFIPRIK